MNADPRDTPVAVIGLGLMGSSIIACLLAAGHPVLGLTRDVHKRAESRAHIADLLRQMRDEGLLQDDPESLLARFEISDDYTALSDRSVIIESIIENWDAKKEILRRVEENAAPDALIGSNTSSMFCRL